MLRRKSKTSNGCPNLLIHQSSKVLLTEIQKKNLLRFRCFLVIKFIYFLVLIDIRMLYLIT